MSDLNFMHPYLVTKASSKIPIQKQIHEVFVNSETNINGTMERNKR